MSNCVCSRCINLKQYINEESDKLEYVCKFGYPSEECEDCEGEQCSITECSHYIEDKEDMTVRKVYCKGCGIELHQMYEDEADGDVFCVSCYLNSK